MKAKLAFKSEKGELIFLLSITHYVVFESFSLLPVAQDRLGYLTMSTECIFFISRVARKPVFRVSDQVQHKQGCTNTEDGKSLENSELGSRGILLSKALVSCVVTTQLICAFPFPYGKSRFSHDAAHIYNVLG